MFFVFMSSIRLDKFVKKRREIFQKYFNAISSIEGINFMDEGDYCKSNRWLTTLTIDEKKTGIDRDKIISTLEKENIESRPVWKPMHLQPLYNEYEYVSNDDRDVSAELFENGLCLPSGSNLSEKDQNRIIDIILSLLN